MTTQDIQTALGMLISLGVDALLFTLALLATWRWSQAEARVEQLQRRNHELARKNDDMGKETMR